jgi:hypothetical protein
VLDAATMWESLNGGQDPTEDDLAPDDPAADAPGVAEDTRAQ